MSRERRFFVADLDAARVELSEDEAHHLIRVLRLREGDPVAVFDGRGRAANAVVARISGDTVSVDVGDALPSNESPFALTVAVTVPKGDTMTVIVQKLTELGAAAIQPLVSEHGELSADVIDARRERWRRVAMEAAKQCGRSRVPAVEPSKPFEDVARAPAVLLAPGAPPPTSAAPSVLVGPEGGWSSDELALADERGLARFGLGPRTLRTDTAAIAAATLMQWLGGDFR